MKKKSVSLLAKALAIILCISMTAAGCMAARKPATPYTPYQVTITPGPVVSPAAPVVPASPAAVSPTPQPTLDPPPELERIRTAAVSMVSSILAKDWDRTGSLYGTLEKDWNSYKAKASSANIGAIQIGSFSSDIAALNRSIAAKKQYEAAYAANRLMMGAINFMKLYRSTTPFEIGELEYYERNVLLASQNNDWVLAKAACDSAFSVWKNLKVRATAVSAARSRIYADTLTKLRNAAAKQDVKTAKKYSERILSENEAMRKDFAK